MHSARISLLLLTAVLVGCEKPSSEAPIAPPAAPPSRAQNSEALRSAPLAASSPTLEIPLTLTVQQRSTTKIPGSNEQLALTIDDVTRGQVMVSLLDEQRATIAGPISMEVEARLPFDFNEQAFSLRLTELSNAIVGDDFATFVIEAPEQDELIDAALTEDQKIERLILSVEMLDDAMFLRNGTSHSANDAAQHLRRKLASAGDQIRTATDFIEQIASKSSLTGEEYSIRMPDGRTIKAGDFLRQELEQLSTDGG